MLDILPKEVYTPSKDVHPFLHHLQPPASISGINLTPYFALWMGVSLSSHDTRKGVIFDSLLQGKTGKIVSSFPKKTIIRHWIRLLCSWCLMCWLNVKSFPFTVNIYQKFGKNWQSSSNKNYKAAFATNGEFIWFEIRKNLDLRMILVTPKNLP